MAFVPVTYHIGPYENAWKSEKVEKVPTLLWVVSMSDLWAILNLFSQTEVRVALEKEKVMPRLQG